MFKKLGFLVFVSNLVFFGDCKVEGNLNSFNISSRSGNDLLTDEEKKFASNEIEREIVKDQLSNEKNNDELLTAEAKQKRGLCCSSGPGVGSGRYPSDHRYPDRYGGGGGGHRGDYPSSYGSDGHSGPSGGGYGTGYSFGHSASGGDGGGGLYRPYRPSGSGPGYQDGPSGHGGGSYGGSYGHGGYDDGYHGHEGGIGGLLGGNLKSYALKKLLLPLAGLAIVGVAAAISQNPVLLQLGTIRGRKRRSAPVEEDWRRVYPGNPKVRPFVFGRKKE